MSGTASVPNTFASVTTATGAQLDADFSTVVAYINDPTNRNNYAADTGTTNTVVLSFVPAVLGYTAGLELTFKAANTNSGATVINANSLGNKNLVNSDGTALTAGQINAGSVYKAVYDGTVCVGIFGSVAATAAQQSAGVSITSFTSPGRQQQHPSAAKAWGFFNGTNTGTITALSSYNVSNIVRQGTGSYAITFTTPMSNTAFVVAGSSPTRVFSEDGVVTRTTAGFNILVITSGGSTVDSTAVNFITFGN